MTISSSPVVPEIATSDEVLSPDHHSFTNRSLPEPGDSSVGTEDSWPSNDKSPPSNDKLSPSNDKLSPTKGGLDSDAEQQGDWKSSIEAWPDRKSSVITPAFPQRVIAPLLAKADDNDDGDDDSPAEDNDKPGFGDDLDDTDDELDEFDDIDEDDFDDDFDDDFEEELDDDYEIAIDDEISAEFGLNTAGDDLEDEEDDLDDFEDFDAID